MGLVDKVDTGEISIASFLSSPGRAEVLARTFLRSLSINLFVDPLKRGMGCPGLQQRSIHREVLVAEQGLDLQCSNQLLVKLPHPVTFRKVVTPGLPFTWPRLTVAPGSVLAPLLAC